MLAMYAPILFLLVSLALSEEIRDTSRVCVEYMSADKKLQVVCGPSVLQNPNAAFLGRSQGPNQRLFDSPIRNLPQMGNVVPMRPYPALRWGEMSEGRAMFIPPYGYPQEQSLQRSSLSDQSEEEEQRSSCNNGEGRIDMNMVESQPILPNMQAHANYIERFMANQKGFSKKVEEQQESIRRLQSKIEAMLKTQSQQMNPKANAETPA